MARPLAVVLLVLLTVMGVRPVSAALDVKEKAEAKGYYIAFGSLARAAGCLSVLVRDHTDDAVTTASIHAVGDRIASMWRHLIYAQAYLLGANPYPEGSGSHTTLEAQPRAIWVSNGWTSANAALLAKAAVDTATDAAKANVNATGAMQLDCVKSSVSRAAASIKAVNRALTYTEARSHSRMVGPHGTYTKAVNLAVRSLLLTVDAFDAILQMYNAPAAGEAIWNGARVGEPLHNFQDIIVAIFERVGLNLSRVLFHYALIPLNITECGYTDLHLIGRTLERLLSEHSESNSGSNIFGNPYAYVVALQVWQDGFRNGLTTRPLAHAKWDAWRVKWLLSWTFSDGAAWQPLEFPTDVTLADLRGQANVAGTANTKPLCDATVAPTVAMTYPANGETVGGWITVTFTCLDNVTCIKGRVKIDGVEVPTDLIAVNNGITTYAPVGSTTSGTPNLVVGNSWLGFVVGDVITGTNIPPGTTVTAIPSKTSITISQNATATGRGITFTTTHPITIAYRLDTKTLSNGPHTIVGVGYDNALNPGDSAAITVTVRN